MRTVLGSGARDAWRCWVEIASVWGRGAVRSRFRDFLR